MKNYATVCACLDQFFSQDRKNVEKLLEGDSSTSNPGNSIFKMDNLGCVLLVAISLLTSGLDFIIIHLHVFEV